ncbi:MAG: oligosaccharide flippase family protein [Chitinophagaceae bacterium]|nr:oligosaccharide flippase family protein [Chitinophagaceae bacterium]
MPLKQNLVYNFLLSVSQVLFPLITIPYVSRVLAPDMIGRVGFIDSYTYFFTVLAEFGIITYGVREISKKKGMGEGIDGLVSELLVIQFISGLVTLVPFFLSLFYLKKSFTEPALLIWAIVFYLSNLFYSEWFFWGTERFKFVAIRSFAVRSLATVCVFLLVKTGEDYIYYYAIMSSAGVLNLLINFLQLSKLVKIKLKNVAIKKHFKPLLAIHGITLCYAAFGMLDTPLLRFSSHSEYQTGIYVFSIKLIRTASSLITDFLLVLFPFSIAVQQNNSSLWKSKIRESSSLILMFSIPMTVGIFTVAPVLTRLYFGQGFTEIAISLRWLSSLVFLVSLELFLNKQLLLANHLENATLKVAGICSLIFIGSAIYWGARWGYKGAAMAMITAETAMLLGYILLKNRFIPGVSIFNVADFLKIVLASSAMYFLIYLFPNQEFWKWPMLLLFVFCSILTYFFIVLVVCKISLKAYIEAFLFEKSKIKK